jgi:hypothetical protein
VGESSYAAMLNVVNPINWRYNLPNAFDKSVTKISDQSKNNAHDRIGARAAGSAGYLIKDWRLLL